MLVTSSLDLEMHCAQEMHLDLTYSYKGVCTSTNHYMCFIDYNKLFVKLAIIDTSTTER